MGWIIMKTKLKGEPVLKFENVWKVYQMGEVEVPAVQGVSFEVRQGEFVAITGSSGSGKSTMMALAGCLDRPTKGKIFLDGNDISSLKESRVAELRGKRIGFVFQQFNLIPTLTALGNVMLPMEFQDYEVWEMEARAKELLKIVDLADRMHHKPTELSGGQNQRVAIARALANNPEIVLADEPTGNLDSKTGKYIMDFLTDLNKKGKTIVLVTHDIHLVKYAKRIIQLKDGKIEKEISTGGNEK